jgi:hypothetical protein
MQIIELKVITVESQSYWTDSGIDLLEDTRYRISSKGIWRDAGYDCDANGHSGNAFINSFAFLRRHRPSAWFALIGSIDRKHPFHIGAEWTGSPPRSGRLYLFANDARLFYFNNHGAITCSINQET